MSNNILPAFACITVIGLSAALLPRLAAPSDEYITKALFAQEETTEEETTEEETTEEETTEEETTEEETTEEETTEEETTEEESTELLGGVDNAE